MRRLRSLPILVKNYWWLFLVITVLLVIVDSLVRGIDWSNWAESSEPLGPRAVTLWGRSLWDWADLLLVPFVLAIGGFLLQRSERAADREIAEKRHKNDQDLAESRYANDKEIARNTHMDKTLDEYLKTMTGFLLQENSLLKSKKDDPIRDVARTQTITVINRLDSERNKIVFQFLQEADLLSRKKDPKTDVEKPIVSLAYADLKSTNLEGVNLKNADLNESDLSGAHLNGAILISASLKGALLVEAKLGAANLTEAHLESAYLFKTNLRGANLSKAHLHGAILNEAKLNGTYLQDANLTNANLTDANIEKARFTDLDSMIGKGFFWKTVMPDGTIFSESIHMKEFMEPPRKKIQDQSLSN